MGYPPAYSDTDRRAFGALAWQSRSAEGPFAGVEVRVVLEVDGGAVPVDPSPAVGRQRRARQGRSLTLLAS